MDASLPQGPELSPEEQTFEWFSRPFAFLKSSAQRYGETFTLEFKGLGKHVVFSHPSAIQKIFTGDSDVFHAGEGNAIIRPFLGELSLLLLDGQTYRRHRKLMLPAFQPKRIALYAPMMEEIVESSLEKWKTGEPFAVHKEMLAISLEIILRTVFGMGDADRLTRMKSLLVSLLEAVSFSTLIHPSEETHAGASGAWDRFRKLMGQLEALMRSEITDHRAKPGSHDVLSLLLAEGDAENAPLSDEELRDELKTLLIAGHETTATALSWAFYWVLSSPEVKRRLIQEIDELESRHLPGPERLEAWLSLPYLDAVVKETLRINPVIPVVSRRLTAPIEIEGRSYPAGTHLMPCIYLAHRREQAYPEPDKFRPERFLERRFSQFEYLPFGGGVRRCLGMAFGQTEIKIVLARALRRFSFELAEKAAVRPVRRSVVVAPSGGVRLVAVAR